MKIDVDVAMKYNLLGKVEVRLNGLIAHECVAADEEKCIVKVFRKDKYLAGMRAMPTEILKGDVEIIFGNIKV